MHLAVMMTTCGSAKPSPTLDNLGRETPRSHKIYSMTAIANEANQKRMEGDGRGALRAPGKQWG